MNKYFINKQNGIKQSDTNKKNKTRVLLFIVMLTFSLFFTSIFVNAEEPLKTYTKNFQNQTTTLSGKAVETNMYFTTVGYWEIKNALFNFTYELSTLAKEETSDITLSLNGVTFYSFRPKNKKGIQTESVELPLTLLKSSNLLRIEGQIVTQTKDQRDLLTQTPANWITLMEGSNINFEYIVTKPEPTLHSFYDHFSGQDTVANHQSTILVSDQASPDELSASMIALAGESRVITTDHNQIQVTNFSSYKKNEGDFLMVISEYNHLPEELKKEVTEKEVTDQAVIKTIYHNQQYYLLVTAKKGELLQKAARFIANSELMSETDKSTKFITKTTDTATSIVNDEGIYHLTDKKDRINGTGHRLRNYFIHLPNDRSNADGSQVHLFFRYSKNLNFNRSLVTLSINDTIIGSKKLSDIKANNDEFILSFPKGIALGNSFTIQVAFDLEMNDQNETDNSQMPWAEIDATSKLEIKSERSNQLLLSNYPALFMKNETYDNLAVVLPKTLEKEDFQALTNIFNLIGSFAKHNTGTIQFYTDIPDETTLKSKNVIVLGTPTNNKMIKELNEHLYFQYAKDYSYMLSNEKLSIEEDYGKTIGTVQLIRSPYNETKGMLVVTGKSPKATYLATTQINFQKNIQQYNGDAIVVDTNNNHYGYRFKENEALDKRLATKKMMNKNRSLFIYFILIGALVVALGWGTILTLKKQGTLYGGKKNDK